jgi:hypothetical protein
MSGGDLNGEARAAVARMPEAQYRAVLGCVAELATHEWLACWHFNECGCCVSVHATPRYSGGFVVGRDGGVDWHNLDHEHEVDH